MNILLLRIGRLGDMVMVAPAIRYLLDRHPRAQITLVTSPDGARLYRNFDPRLTDFRVFRKSNPGRRISRIELARWLKTRSFDRKYCLETDERHHRILAAVPGDTVAMTAEAADAFRHYTLSCLRLVGHPNPQEYRPRPPLFPVSVEGEDNAAELLARLGITSSDIVIGLNPTFGAALRRFRQQAKKSKNWPAASWARVVDALAEWGRRARIEVKALIDVLPEETAIAREIAALSRHGIHIANELPDFERYKAILRRMNLLIAPDTGTMHLAAAMGTPLLALYSASDPEMTGPFPFFRDQTAIVKTSHTHQALDSISPDVVIQQAIGLLDRVSRSDRLPSLESQS